MILQCEGGLHLDVGRVKVVTRPWISRQEYKEYVYYCKKLQLRTYSFGRAPPGSDGPRPLPAELAFWSKPSVGTRLVPMLCDHPSPGFEGQMASDVLELAGPLPVSSTINIVRPTQVACGQTK